MNPKTDLERKTSADNTSIQSKLRETVTKVLAETYRRLTSILRAPKAQPSSRTSNNQVAKIDIKRCSSHAYPLSSSSASSKPTLISLTIIKSTQHCSSQFITQNIHIYPSK